jgi:hypothetical protein
MRGSHSTASLRHDTQHVWSQANLPVSNKFEPVFKKFE